MNWFAWKQHRKQFLIIGILLALFAALIIPTGISFWHTYQQTLANCHSNPATPECSDLQDNLFQSSFDTMLLHLVPLGSVFLPLILGIFWGAPLLAREYADGTNKLVWTQSVSRRKWLSAKLLYTLLGIAIFVGLFSAAVTLWSRTPNALYQERFTNGLDYFTAQDIVPIAYGIFTVSLAIMFGTWFKRTMAAVGLTLVAFIAIVMIIVPSYIRPHYMAPITVTAKMGPEALSAKIPGNAWIINQHIEDKYGNSVNRLDFTSMPTQCQQLIQQSQVRTGNGAVAVKVGPNGADLIDNCLNNAGYHQVAEYQPAYRYWDFQRIETGLYLIMSLIPIGATYWLVLKRDA